ncbi:hypothetical protein VTK26DRAFT_8474 [Humicola hyalothermophila]
MNSETSVSQPDASGTAPKQLDSIPSLKLSDGNELPMISYGLGTANWKTGNRDELNDTIINNVLTAIKSGYYSLDGAEVYGNELDLGAAIARSGVPRSKLFVTTKTSCRPGTSIETAFNQSLAKLGLEYVDLYLIHSPFFASSAEELQQKWAEMEALKESGRARSIGVSNFLREHLEALLATPGGLRHPPVVNQIEYHPYLQHVDDRGFFEFHREHNVALQAYAPLTALTKAKPGPVDGVYERLAAKYGVGSGEVALRWCLDQGIAVITTSAREERLRGYMNRLPAFKLTPEEVEEISEKGKEKHFRGFWGNKYAENDRR